MRVAGSAGPGRPPGLQTCPKLNSDKSDSELLVRRSVECDMAAEVVNVVVTCQVAAALMYPVVSGQGRTVGRSPNYS